MWDLSFHQSRTDLLSLSVRKQNSLIEVQQASYGCIKMFVCGRSGVLSVTSLRTSWRISTTAPCCAWTAQRTTRRKTQYSVRRCLSSGSRLSKSSATCPTLDFPSATRVQFFAVEIARNREGHNDAVFTSKSSKS